MSFVVQEPAKTLSKLMHVWKDSYRHQWRKIISDSGTLIRFFCSKNYLKIDSKNQWRAFLRKKEQFPSKYVTKISASYWGANRIARGYPYFKHRRFFLPAHIHSYSPLLSQAYCLMEDKNNGLVPRKSTSYEIANIPKSITREFQPFPTTFISSQSLRYSVPRRIIHAVERCNSACLSQKTEEKSTEASHFDFLSSHSTCEIILSYTRSCRILVHEICNEASNLLPWISFTLSQISGEGLHVILEKESTDQLVWEFEDTKYAGKFPEKAIGAAVADAIKHIQILA